MILPAWKYHDPEEIADRLLGKAQPLRTVDADLRVIDADVCEEVRTVSPGKDLTGLSPFMQRQVNRLRIREALRKAKAVK